MGIAGEGAAPPPFWLGVGGGVSLDYKTRKGGIWPSPPCLSFYHLYVFYNAKKKLSEIFHVCFFVVTPHPFPQKTAKLDRCSVLIAIEQWGLFSWPTPTVTHETRKADAPSASRTRHIHTWGPFKTGCKLKPKSVTKPENQSKLRFSKGILI